MKSETLKMALGVFAVFVLAYFCFFGRAAKISGSWDYVMRTSDDSFCWSAAKGASEVPTHEANVYYYEAIGQSFNIPYPTLKFVGWLSRILGISVLSFFPIWHIALPCLLWLTLFFCLTRLWGYPVRPSAVFALILLLSTVFLRDVSHHILFRFPHPGDVLWLLWIWISAVFNRERLLVFLGKQSKWEILLTGSIAFIVFWVYPFSAFLGMMVTCLEAAWQLFVVRDRKSGVRLVLIALSVLTAAFLYGIYVRTHSPAGDLERELVLEEYANIRTPELVSLYLYGIILAVVLAAKKMLRRPLTVMDRLLLFVLFIEPLNGNLQVILPKDILIGYHRHNLAAELAHHRYGYLVIEIAALIGWMLEKMPEFKLEKFERYFVPCLVMIQLLLFANADTNFFRFAPHTYLRSDIANPMVLLSIVPMLFLGVWAFLRFESLRRVICRPGWVVAIILGMVCTGYPLLAGQMYNSQTHRYNFNDFPFGEAYRWLNANARKNDVVLTVPPSRLDIDYLLLHTDLKTYINPFGNIFGVHDAKKTHDDTFRFLVYFNLLLDDFKGFIYHDIDTVEEKLNYLKLDYILVETPSPFLAHITDQLQGYIETVYQDKRALILKILK